MTALSSPALVDLTIYQGAELLLEYAWEHNGVAQDLTGYTPKAQIRDYVGGLLILDLAPYLSVNLTTQRVVLNVPAGITHTVTNSGVWDMFLINTDPNANVMLLKGDVTLVRAVTQIV